MSAGRNIVLGIDLGSSTSTAGAWINRRFYPALDERGEFGVPSAVHFPSAGPPLVGLAATRARFADPAGTVTEIKRLLGCTYDSPAARLIRSRAAHDTRPARNGRLLVVAGGRKRTTSEVAAALLGHLRELARRRFRLDLRRAVITLPVGASPEMETDMQRAARAAGLDLLETVAEPCAGAVGCGATSEAHHRRLLVFDMGGGSVDVTVLEQRGERLQILGEAGDDSLGGDDLDQRMAGVIAAHVRRRHQVDLRADEVSWTRLCLVCESAKRVLSRQEEHRLFLPPSLWPRDERQRHLLLRRTNVERHWHDLAMRAAQVAATALRRAELRPSAVEQILMIGGSSQVPLIRRTLEHTLRLPAVLVADPQVVVARGAAIAGARHARLLRGVSLVECRQPRREPLARAV